MKPPPPRRLLLYILLLALAAGLAGNAAGAPRLAALLWPAGALLAALAVARDVWRALRGGALGVDIIALLAILGAVALGENLAAIIIGLMVAGGNALEEFAEARATRELSALLARTPRIAHRETEAGLADIGVDAVAPGDTLLVKPGETVPVDGLLLDAPAMLDESALTGEPGPVTHPPGAAIRSGPVNAGGALRMRATAAAEASTYAAIVRLVRQASAERPPLVRLADRWALGFLGFTLALAAAAWALSGSPVRALAVLVVATPCPLILAAPVALVCGISRAARRGVIVKGGGALERLARARTVVFDKTGTLTGGAPRLTATEALDGFDPDEVLRLAASLDQFSQHAMAAAIVAGAQAAGLRLSPPGAVEEIAGGGLAGTVDGRRLVLGSAGLLEAAGLAIPAAGAAVRLAAAAPAAAWLAIDGQVAGALLFADRIRPETPRALRALRAAGLRRLVMATGDRAETAQAIGAALGLDAVHAELSPAGKIGVLQAERAGTRAVGAVTMVVGDGINDAPALAGADIGVAMGARGAAAAAEAADVVLLVDRLDRVAEAVVAAREARWIALQSIAAGMGLSAIAMLVAAAGHLPPVAGALLQEAIDVATILNALRALRAGNLPAPLADRGAVRTLVTEHAALRALLARMHRLADRMGEADGAAWVELPAIRDALATTLLPHQHAEEKHLYPELAARLGGRDPLGTMARFHEEIEEQATRLAALIDGAGAHPSEAELREARRLLYVLDALIALHLATEEELVSHVEDLPAHA
jgi:heavy metal translocating P-type ATPase